MVVLAGFNMWFLLIRIYLVASQSCSLMSTVSAASSLSDFLSVSRLKDIIVCFNPLSLSNNCGVSLFWFMIRVLLPFRL